MRQKNPYDKEYGRHSSFRHSGGDSGSSLAGLGKWLAVLFTLLFVVLGYERLRKSRQPPAPVPVAEASSVPIASAAANSQRDAEPLVIPPPPLPRAAAPLRTLATPEPVAAPEPPKEVEVVAKYEMGMNNHSNSFVGQGYVNGRQVTLLADTGASMVVVPHRLAQQLGLKPGARMTFKTGGGLIAHYATVLDTLTLGEIEMHNVEAAINPAMQEDFILLGMTALGMVDMEVVQDDGPGRKKLVLKYKQQKTAGTGLRTIETESFKRPVKDCLSSGNKIDKQTLDCLRGL